MVKDAFQIMLCSSPAQILLGPFSNLHALSLSGGFKLDTIHSQEDSQDGQIVSERPLTARVWFSLNWENQECLGIYVILSR